MSTNNLPVRNVYAGEIIFKEGQVGAGHMFIIKEGQVEIFQTRGEKIVTLGTLERGAYFGEMALISEAPRSATAKAASYCELYVIDADAIQNILSTANPILRHMVKTMVKVIKNQNEMTARLSTDQPKMVAYAHLLELLAREAGFKGSGADKVSLEQQKIIDKATIFFGDARPVVHATLRFMNQIQLLAIEGNSIRFEPAGFSARVSKLPEAVLSRVGDKVQSEQTLIEIAEAQKMIGVDRPTLLQNLVANPSSDDLFAFRRAMLERLLQEKGPEYFGGSKPEEQAPAEAAGADAGAAQASSSPSASSAPATPAA